MFIRRAFLVSAGLLSRCCAPASARASAVSVNGATLSFAAVDGEANDVTVAFAPGTYTIAERAARPVSAWRLHAGRTRPR